MPRSLTAVVVRGISVASSGFLLTQFLTLATYVALARLAPPKTFGTFAAASIIGIVANVFTESGMSAALIQRRRDIEEAAATALVSTVVGGTFLALLAAALAPAVGFFFQSGEITRVALAMAGVHVLNGLIVVPEALMVRRLLFARAVVVEPLSLLAFAGTCIFSFVEGFGIWSLVFGSYASSVARAALAWTFCRWLPDLRLTSFAMWKELARFARHVVLSEILRESRQALNVALIGRVLGAAPLGEYRFGWRIATQLPAPAAQAGSYVLLPTFSRMAEDRERLGRAFLRSLRSLCLVTTPLTLMLIPLGAPVAVLVFGRQWHQAGVVAASLVGVSATVPLIQVASEIYKATGRPENLPVLHLLLAVIPGTLMFCGVPFGVVGVAVGVSIGTAIVSLEAIRRASSIVQVRLSDTAKVLWPSVVSGVLSSAAVLTLDRTLVHAVARGTFEGLGLILAEFSLGMLIAVAVSALLARDLVRDLREAVRSRRLRQQEEPFEPTVPPDVEPGSLEPYVG
jgi:O-antigen/teichoic acid export membrane protein